MSLKNERRRKFTPEVIEYIREIAPGRFLDEIVEMVQNRFGFTTTKVTIKKIKYDNGIRSGHDSGLMRTNKYKQGLPVGTIRRNAKGELIIKVGNKHNTTRNNFFNWQYLSHFIYEQYTGETIPKGYKIVMLDGNRDNIVMDNMRVVSNSTLCRLNWRNQNGKIRSKLKDEDPDVLDTIITLCQLDDAISKRKKGAGK